MVVVERVAEKSKLKLKQWTSCWKVVEQDVHTEETKPVLELLEK